MTIKNKVYLMILDGFGEGKDYEGNAITRAKTPHLDFLRSKYPLAFLKAHGEAVGLPEGTQGGSEVGHFTIGAGRVVFQIFEEINRSIKNGEFFQKEALLEACKKVNSAKRKTLHLIGMISDQGIHAHLNHLFALLELAKSQGVKEIYIHAITDGRDVPEKTAEIFIAMILQKIKDLGMDPENEEAQSKAKIATIIGRYYAMDRDNNWDRTAKAYNLYTVGKGTEEQSPLEAIQNSYARGIATDYYIEPIILEKKGLIHEEDVVIFWNFRTDRTRQLTQCFTGEKLIGFKPKKVIRPFFVCMGNYSEKAPVVFYSPIINNNLGSVLEQNNLTQLRLAETEKYAHVTYFFNSQIETPFQNETRILINSPKTKSYAEKPEMSAYDITQQALKEMKKNTFDVIIQNFANPDLVGHSANFSAAVKAVEVMDECIGKIAQKALEEDYNLIITADHGNVEYMIYEGNGEPCPSHTKNPVPCLLVSKKYEHAKFEKEGNLADIAPTILAILEIPKPAEMTGKSLFISNIPNSNS